MSLVLVSHEPARPELVLQAYHVLLTHHRPDATLVISGRDPGPDVREYARQLGLRGASFVQDAPPEGMPVRVVADSPLLTVEALLAQRH